MRPLPVSLQLDDRAVCLVVGGGTVGLRKIRWLREHGIRAVVLAPSVCPDLVELATADSGITLERAPYVSGDLSPYALVFAATDDREVNRTVATDAARACVPVNIADDPEGSSFLVPSTIRRGPVEVTVQTGGLAPGYSAALADRIGQMIPENTGAFVESLGRVRGWVKQHVTDAARRAVILRDLSSHTMQNALAHLNHPEEIEAALRAEALKFIEQE